MDKNEDTMDCQKRFAEIYGREPEALAFCPYRICPMGAHSDHNLGKITGFAIDKGIHIAYPPKLNVVVGMTIVPDGGGLGLFDLEGWWGSRSKYLIRGWYSKDNPNIRIDVTLLTDQDDHITGIRTQGSGVFGSRREYTFTWKGEVPLLKQDGIPVIN